MRPLLPIAPGVDALAAPVVSPPTISVMILSIAATSVPQLAPAAPALPVAALPGDADSDLASADRCCLSSASCERVLAGTDVVVMLSAACFAWLRCSWGETV